MSFGSMRLYVFGTAIVLSLPLAAVGQEKRSAPTSQPAAQAAGGGKTVNAADADGTYRADPVHSSNAFRIRHADVANFYGRFNEISGSYTLNHTDPAACKFEFEIKTESIDTNNDGRDKHLRSPELFDAAKYPTISFKSTKVKPVGDHTYEVTGDLTLHGVTKPLTTHIELTGANAAMRGQFRSGLETVFSVDRRDYGITAAPGMLGDEVRIMVSIEGVRE